VPTISIPGAVAPFKDALAAYWRKVAKRALPYLARRPLKLVRHQDGQVFYHEARGPLPAIPPSVHTITIQKREGGVAIRPWVDSLAGLLELVEMDVVEIHPWGARIDDIERPDMLVFDLHPGEGIEREFLIESALRLRDILHNEGLDGWPKITGVEDLHVHVPFESSLEWDAARHYCKVLAEDLVGTAPERYTLQPGAAARKGRIHIDVMRNGRGATAIGAYSPMPARVSRSRGQ
jgi:bifunctional non-homologous end joining protein LigD